MPSTKPKPHEQKDQKKQKSLLGWLSKSAATDTKVANSSSAVNALVTGTSSSPSGRDSIFETPSTKKRTTLGIDSPAVGSATFTKSSDGGRSIDETPPTSDPIDVDISSDEDLPGRGIKSVCDTSYMRFYASGDSLTCSRLAQSGRSLSKIQMKKHVAMPLQHIKGCLHIGLREDPVGWTPFYITGLLID